MKLSLVVPCYNEADNVALFQQAVISAFDGCGYDYEIVFIDDGSRDATLHNLKKLYAAQECPVKVVSFSRNFGKEAGIYAGLQHAAGDYICLIDADLQQRPEIVRNMVKFWTRNRNSTWSRPSRIAGAKEGCCPSSKSAFTASSTSCPR